MPTDKLNSEEILNFQQKIKNNPVWFAENVLGLTLWEKEREIFEAVKNNPLTAIRSCNGSGKTFTAGNIVHWWLLSFKDSVVITTAPTGRQVRETLWREIRNSAIGKSLYPADAVLQTQINLGDKWYALGIATDNLDSFQGFHSENLLAIVDEASGVSEEVFRAIDSLHPKRLLLIGNPLRNSGRFAEVFKDPDVKKIRISAFDTPNIKEGKIVIPGLITCDDIERIEKRYGEDSDVWRIRILGEFPTCEQNVLFAIDAIQNAIERSAESQEDNFEKNFEKKMGVDVARFGDDRSVITIRQQSRIVRREIFSKIDTMEIVGQILRIAREEKISPQNINIDEIGVGAGVIDRLKEQGWNACGINVAEKAEDGNRFANLRAELYAKLRDWLPNAKLPDDEYFELANIKYKFNSKGQMQIEAKEDMKKRGISSPDIADSLMLTFANKTIHFGGASEARWPSFWAKESQESQNNVW